MHFKGDFSPTAAKADHQIDKSPNKYETRKGAYIYQSLPIIVPGNQAIGQDVKSEPIVL